MGGVLAGGGGVGVDAAAARCGRRRPDVVRDRAEAAPGGVHWGLLLLPRHGSRAARAPVPVVGGGGGRTARSRVSLAPL
jgi:hypothetical protein